MKAITCSQCGALIKGISMRKEVAVCDYCGAEMRLKQFEKKVIEIPDKVADQIKTESNWEIYLRQRDENRQRYAQMSGQPVQIVETDFNLKAFLLPLIVIFFVFGLPVILYFTFNKSQNLKYPDFQVKTEISYSIHLKTEKTHFPKISRSELSEKEVEELKELSADQRSVPVKVRIDEKGFVIWAKAGSENSILREKSESAALQTTFYPTGKVLTETITYNFYYR